MRANHCNAHRLTTLSVRRTLATQSDFFASKYRSYTSRKKQLLIARKKSSTEQLEFLQSGSVLLNCVCIWHIAAAAAAAAAQLPAITRLFSAWVTVTDVHCRFRNTTTLWRSATHCQWTQLLLTARGRWTLNKGLVTLWFRHSRYHECSFGGSCRGALL